MATVAHALSEQPHELSVALAVAEFGSDLDQGLTSLEVQSRLVLWGPNALADKAEKSAWKSLLHQFRDVQVYLLLAATAVSFLVWVYEGANGFPYEAATILAIVLINAGFGFLQEERAGRALESLRLMTPAEATVLRDGNRQRVGVRTLVPGDILLLEEGDRIAADGRLVEVVCFQTQEAELTGESLPVEKCSDPLPHDTLVADRRNMIHSGTTAVSGHAKAIVTATGPHTEFGRIAQLLNKTVEHKTPLQQDLDRLGKRLGFAVLVIAAITVAAVLVVNGGYGVDRVLRALIFGVALAVAATPEGLGAVVTVVLAIGVRRMARRGAIVRHLAAVETLGEVTVIASDKTGTMTLNRMTVNEIVTASGAASASSHSTSDQDEWISLDGTSLPPQMHDELLLLLKSAALVNNARLKPAGATWSAQGDPTEAALLLAAIRAGIDLQELNQLHPRVCETPFSSGKKRMSTLHHCDGLNVIIPAGSHIWITKGAPDLVLETCTHEVIAGGGRILTPARKVAILHAIDDMAGRGLRTLGVAIKRAPEAAALNCLPPHEPEHGLTFVGLIGMSDPPRPEAAPAVRSAASAGIRSILITGDHAKTAVAIARTLGIATDANVLTGTELNALSDADLRSAVRNVSVFARVNPEHKLRIVTALQQNGEIVAMTGDGVNDAPALKAADIGVAMGLTGTDVAKEAADLVLTDDNFATIVAAIEEGRTIFGNIRKFLRYLLATNFGEIVTLLAGVLIIGATEPNTNKLVLPLLAVQILWVNLVTDGAPALALGLDSPSANVMRRAPFRAGTNIVDRLVMQDIGIVAFTMAVGTLWIFFHGTMNETMQYRRSLAFTTLILFQLFNAFEARSSVESGAAQLFRNKWLWGTVVATLGLQGLLLSVNFFARAFAVESLPLAQWVRCIAVASSVIWVMEAVKWIRRRGLVHRHPEVLI